MTTASSQLTDLITLTTQDDPSTRHLVSRSRLMVLSPFFRDLLTLPQIGNSESQDQVEIPLTDPQEKVKGLVMVLQEKEEEFRKLNNDDWSNLVQVADKYDCKAARKEVVTQMWESLSRGKYSNAFDLAIELEHYEVIQKYWALAADEGWELGTGSPRARLISIELCATAS
ncbi:hypothetical protein JCM5350_005983 [Sporobolomyces pararoseus]